MSVNARFAFVNGARRRDEVAAYLPTGFAVIGEGEGENGKPFYIIGGYDNAGWTLDDYVIPRLASGLMVAKEVDEPKARLECLRTELRAERISYGELIELQNLVEHISPGDVELLEAAGVPEFPEGD